MKISVIMVDGGFRENVFSAEYFSKQNFPENEYEVLWVEFYSKVPESVSSNNKVKVICLNNDSNVTYHSSYCFNEGIKQAKGELLVIPDADQIVEPDFLSKIWKTHEQFDKMVVYAYRFDEHKANSLNTYAFSELKEKCVFKNPFNYGACLTVRKKWLIEINGYEQHPLFESGFHANGLDLYTRFRNYGMAVLWQPDLILYHPWHTNTLLNADNYKEQLTIIKWKEKNRLYFAVNGIDSSKNILIDKSLSNSPPKPVKKSFFNLFGNKK